MALSDHIGEGLGAVLSVQRLVGQSVFIVAERELFVTRAELAQR